MIRLVGMVLAALAALGIGQSGRDLLLTVVNFTQVTVESYTLASIGKRVLAEQTVLERRLREDELFPLLRREMSVRGRDPTHDLWDTAYFLETNGWYGKPFKLRGDEFAVCSAGPDRRWRTPDDLHWTHFDEQRFARR